MKRALVVLVGVLLSALLLVPLGPAAGQGGGDGCDIDLTDVMAALFRAQREADSGNTFAAARIIDEVQAELAALSEACRGVLFPLPQNFTAADNSIAFNYPADWAFLNVQTGAYLVASSRAALNTLSESNLTELPPDEQALLAYAFPLVDVDYQGMSFEDIAAEMRDDIAGSFDRTSGAIPLEVNGRAARRITAESNGMTVILDLIDYTDAEQPAILLLGGFATGELAASIELILEAFEASVQFPALVSLREPGVALDQLAYGAAPVSVRDLNEDIDPRYAVLSPDGLMIAWFERGDDALQMCVYGLATRATDCALIPESFRSLPPVLHWSPDSAYVAFTADFFRTFREADIVVYDVTANRVINLTDDGILRWNLLTPPEDAAGQNAWIDPIVTWGPDGYIYFYRMEVFAPDYDRDAATQGLYRISPQGGDPELLGDITGLFENFPIYYSQTYSLDGAMSLSPDAKQLAFIVREPELDSDLNGVWVLDLSGDAQPRHLAGYDAFGATLPPGLTSQFTVPTALAWNANGAGLFVIVEDYSFQQGFQWVYQVDVESGTVTPLIDFGDLDAAALQEPDPETGLSPSFLMPKYTLLAPDASGLLLFHLERGTAGISVVHEVDGVWRQDMLATFEDFSIAPSSLISGAGDGSVLAFGNLIR